MATFKKGGVTGLGEICGTIHPFVHKILQFQEDIYAKEVKEKKNKNLRYIFVKLNSVFS